MNFTTLRVAIPVHNAARSLTESSAKLVEFLESEISGRYDVIIAENGSQDDTLDVALGLGRCHLPVTVIHLLVKGRGRALKAAWGQSPADILAYVDVDMSTDLEALPKLIEPLTRGQYDIAVGSRLMPQSATHRCLKREIISRVYNWLVRFAFGTHFSDAQCGFKAITKKAAEHLLPLVEDNGWFFDTELLVLAEKLGYRILDVPVRWTEGADTTVKIFRTAIEDIKGIIRLRRNLAMGKYREHVLRNTPSCRSSSPIVRPGRGVNPVP